MPTVTLQSCTPVLIFSSEVPSNVAVALAVSGNSGDGQVNVIAAPNPMQPTATAPTGSLYQGSTLGCTSIYLHYQKSEGGPDSIQVTYSYAVS
ncbi:MAG: hypothetical protein K8T90_13320 [Planctomycetes bacterium]|nr:hypothetical protein [Planctomycetota bacterium]